MALYLGTNKVRCNTSQIINVPIINVSDPDELTAMLSSDNIGKIYRYTGETNSAYTNGDLYEVVKL